jgi:hypothetical protein
MGSKSYGSTRADHFPQVCGPRRLLAIPSTILFKIVNGKKRQELEDIGDLIEPDLMYPVLTLSRDWAV